jgi:hypothetical protein
MDANDRTPWTEHGMHGQGRRFLRLVAITTLIAGTSACAHSSDSPARHAEPPSAVALPAGFHRISGTTYEFGLPNNPAYVEDDQRVGPGGSLQMRWRYALTPTGPSCLVLAVEQKNYTGDFPDSSIKQFADADQPEQHTIRNELLKPTPRGASGALNQESTYTSTMSDGRSIPSRLYQRVYLTPGNSLVQFLVGGPDNQAGACHYTDILATFVLTGREFTGATAPSISPNTPSAPSPSSATSTK